MGYSMTKNVPILIALLGIGCAAVPTQKDAAFAFAVEAVARDSYMKGAKAAWNFVDSADPDDPRYDRGLRLLSQSVEGLELEWAAGILYRQIAKERRNMELVPDALNGLRRIVESDIYDEDMFVTSFIASEEFSDLPADLQEFVNYRQGLDLARRGNDEWAQKHFAKIPKESQYAAAAQYVRIVRLIADGDYENAVEKLEALQKRENLSPRIRVDVERTLARLAFEEKRYRDALVFFERLKELAPDDPEILLEMAWTHYYLGDSRKTLGLLVALDAPVHRKHISPERYLLEALALRRLCQFGAAREAAVRLERRYYESLQRLSSGDLPEQIPQMRAAARFRGFSRANALFLERLQYENDLLAEMQDDLGEGLHAYLKDLYARGVHEAEIRFEEQLSADLEELTEELLAAREGVRLIVHELGVSLLRGRRRPAGALEKPAVEVPFSGDRVFYSFSGEFWTDELDDLVVIAEDRCID
jgi:hypothetical protein